MLKVLFLMKQLLKEVMDNQVDTIFIIYKDRFIHFGYDWFERLCKMHNTEIVVLNNIETSPTQKMINDMIKHCTCIFLSLIWFYASIKVN